VLRTCAGWSIVEALVDRIKTSISKPQPPQPRAGCVQSLGNDSKPARSWVVALMVTTVRIWIWCSNRQLGEFGNGHVEIEMGGLLRSLKKDKELPLSPPDTYEFSTVYRGVIPERPARVLAQAAEQIRAERIATRPKLNVAQTPEVTVFSRVVAADVALVLRDYLDEAARNPPDYCPTAIEGTMNCVTFVVAALKHASVLPADFVTTDGQHPGRPYLPNMLHSAFVRLETSGYLTSEQRVLEQGDWVTKVTGPQVP